MDEGSNSYLRKESAVKQASILKMFDCLSEKMVNQYVMIDETVANNEGKKEI